MINTEHIMQVSMTDTEKKEIVEELARRGAGAQFTEWGSGGSTVLWYMNLRMDQRLISIESDPIWHGMVEKKIKELADQGNRRNFDYHLYAMPNDGATFTPEHEYYQPYVRGPEGIWNSDIYLVDGRVRLWCARTVFERATNRDAVVYCHDYAYNGGWWDQLLTIYPRHEVINSPGTEYQMLKLWLK